MRGESALGQIETFATVLAGAKADIARSFWMDRIFECVGGEAYRLVLGSPWQPNGQPSSLSPLNRRGEPGGVTGWRPGPALRRRAHKVSQRGDFELACHLALTRHGR